MKYTGVELDRLHRSAILTLRNPYIYSQQCWGILTLMATEGCAWGILGIFVVVAEHCIYHFTLYITNAGLRYVACLKYAPSNRVYLFEAPTSLHQTVDAVKTKKATFLLAQLSGICVLS